MLMLTATPPQDNVPMEAHLKGLGQKYMGARPDSHAQAMFQGSSMHTTGGHPLPITNFMNAQCT
jgi:saccharopepsin